MIAPTSVSLKFQNEFDIFTSLFPGTISLLPAGQPQKAICVFYHALILPDVLTIALDNFLLDVPHSAFSVFLWGLCGFNDLGVWVSGNSLTSPICTSHSKVCGFAAFKFFGSIPLHANKHSTWWEQLNSWKTDWVCAIGLIYILQSWLVNENYTHTVYGSGWPFSENSIMYPIHFSFGNLELCTAQKWQ